MPLRKIVKSIYYLLTFIGVASLLAVFLLPYYFKSEISSLKNYFTDTAISTVKDAMLNGPSDKGGDRSSSKISLNPENIRKSAEAISGLLEDIALGKTAEKKNTQNRATNPAKKQSPIVSKPSVDMSDLRESIDKLKTEQELGNR